jgi:hypothetical protein
VAKTSRTPQGGNPCHRQFVGGQPMNSNPLKQFPRGVLPVVWISTNPAEIERLKNDN